MRTNQPTIKQQKALKNIVANSGSQADAIRKAGYSESTARNPARVFKAKNVITLKAKLLKKHKLDLNLAFDIIEQAAHAYKVGINKEDGELYISDIADLTMRLKASDRIREILDEDIKQPLLSGTPIADNEKTNKRLNKAIENSEEIELQRIVFKPDNDSNDNSTE